MLRLVAVMGCVSFASVVSAADGSPNPDFDRDIAPLLAEHCLGCHGGPKPRGDLDLTSKKSAVDGRSIKQGEPNESAVWEKVANNEMPPKKPLPDAAKAKLRTWIESGATWGTDPIDLLRYTTSSRAGKDWWSLAPIQRPKVPGLNASWIRDPIDLLVLAKLREKTLTPSPDADRRTLIRRVSFDLIGLPPSPDEVESFIKDHDPDAYEKLVDRLLALPHYGERWARHWLDVVRFGESHGFERNDARPSAWHYRDWVIRALNADLPYDEFVRLQLAGDVLKPGDPDAIKATGYLVAGVHNTVLPKLDAAKETARQDELEDLVGNVGQTFLGLTVHCARCHDHKFDPIAQLDFYRMASAVSGVTHGERPAASTAAKKDLDESRAEVARIERALATLEEPTRSTILAKRSATAPVKPPPTPIAAWDFRSDASKLTPKITLVGAAKLTSDGLVVDGKTGFARSEPIQHDLREKTLEAWVRLDGLAQRGGGVFGVEKPGGSVFDSIVYGEQEPGRWVAGSDHFRRTKPFVATEEKEADRGAVHVAITYHADGAVAGYRDGKPYGKPYRSSAPQAFRSGEFVAIFGIRHEPAGGNRVLAGTIVQARLYDRALGAGEVAASASIRDAITEANLLAAMTPEQRRLREALRQSLAKARTALEQATARADQKVFAALLVQPPVTRLLVRGQVSEPADVVAPGGVGVLPHAGFGLSENASESERRKKLAAWITHHDNPLFARVMANRLWHHHFGTGLVETPSDFGFNGGRPSHPELLDWLASEFVAKQYSLKEMHKLIVTSSAYRQASSPRREALAVDADSRLLWRKKPRRLEAEAVRDAMLSVAGLLNAEVGGKGFTDFRVAGGAGTTYYDPFDPVGPEFHRRSVYRFVPRGGNPGLLETFDCPDSAASSPRRTSTTTPLQALSLWNGPFALRMADAFAERLAKEAPGSIPAQVDRAYQLAFQRSPLPAEATAARALVEGHGLSALCRALFNANEFLMVD